MRCRFCLAIGLPVKKGRLYQNGGIAKYQDGPTSLHWNSYTRAALKEEMGALKGVQGLLYPSLKTYVFVTVDISSAMMKFCEHVVLFCCRCMLNERVKDSSLKVYH